MKKQGGFTLIELVVVIVILGILAVTAVPRFLNLQSDAREASLQGLKGAMAGAGAMVYGKAAIEGVERLQAQTLPDNTEVEYGYPRATDAGIVAVVQGLNDTEEWVRNTSGASMVVTFATSSVTSAATAAEIVATDCYVSYGEAATSIALPSIVVTDSGC